LVPEDGTTAQDEEHLFLLQIRPILAEDVRRETSRVLFLMCPFCVRRMLLG
jgi:hypothetical protein